MFLRFSHGTKIMDAGTGGGLPGIPLAIMFPGATFTLVDSVGKKIRVVSEIGKALGLTNIQPVSARLETITDSFDFITGRAVSDLKCFIGVTSDRISRTNRNDMSNGILYLAGGEIGQWVFRQYPHTSVVPLSGFFEEQYFATKKLVYIPLV